MSKFVNDLTPRKQRILQAVVHGYVETGEPIGSAWLAAHYDFGCRSATLRNEMYEMSEEGYLAQPHVSAGRVPTPVGYRYYVDHLMQPEPIAVRPQIINDDDRSLALLELQELVRQACRFLAHVTEYPSLASAPTRGEVLLHRVFIAPVDRSQALMVALFSTGQTESRLVEQPTTVSGETLRMLTERLNAALAGLSVEAILRRSVEADAVLAPEIAETYSRFVTAVKQIAQDIESEDLMFEGTSLMLRQREFRDVERMERVLAALLEGKTLMRVLRRVGDVPHVSVLIGPETQNEQLDECSIVARRYNAGSRGWGYIGVVGPTRMRYDRAVAAVELAAGALSMALSRTSFA